MLDKSLTIVGGSGFIGKAFYNLFIKKKLNKFNIGKLNLISRFSKNKCVNKKIFYFKYNLINNKGSFPEDSDFIVYAADNTDYKTYNFNYKEITRKKIRNFFYKISKFKKKPKILYISSGAIYGQNIKIKKIKENFRKVITDKADIKSNYAQNKILSEKIFLKKKKYNIFIARLFTVIGPNLPRKYAVSEFVHKAKKKINIKVKSKIKAYRSYLSNKDMINWFLKILTINSKYRIFNVGSDIAVSIDHLASIISKKYKVGYKIVFKKKKLVDFYIPNINLSKKILKITFENNLIKLLNAF